MKKYLGFIALFLVFRAVSAYSFDLSTGDAFQLYNLGSNNDSITRCWTRELYYIKTINETDSTFEVSSELTIQDSLLSVLNLNSFSVTLMISKKRPKEVFGCSKNLDTCAWITGVYYKINVKKWQQKLLLKVAEALKLVDLGSNNYQGFFRFYFPLVDLEEKYQFLDKFNVELPDSAFLHFWVDGNQIFSGYFVNKGILVPGYPIRISASNSKFPNQPLKLRSLKFYLTDSVNTSLVEKYVGIDFSLIDSTKNVFSLYVEKYLPVAVHKKIMKNPIMATKDQIEWIGAKSINLKGQSIRIITREEGRRRSAQGVYFYYDNLIKTGVKIPTQLE